MDIAEEPLTDENLAEAVAFMRRSNPFAQLTWGWDTGRFVDWRWGSNAVEAGNDRDWFGRHCRVFRSESAIQALAVAEDGADAHCIITSDIDELLVRHVLDALVERRTENAGLSFEFSDTAEWLRDIFSSVGLMETPGMGHEWEYDLSDVASEARVPAGFAIETLAGAHDADYAGISECIGRAFGRDSDFEPALRSIEANPMFRPELSVFARNPEGRIAAYCRGTVDSGNGVCGIDPVCTHPDFRRLGLGKAVVQACFATQRDLGGRFSYIGSAMEPAVGTYLYRSLGPSSRTTYCRWGK